MIQVLISTMFLQDPEELIRNMNIQTNAIIIDQCNKTGEEHLVINEFDVDVYHTIDRGTSKSRNLAIEKATADILIFADNDFSYTDGYGKIVQEAYNQFQSADIIVFGAIRKDEFVYKRVPTGKMSKRYQFSINAIRITARRQALLESGVRFDEHFGPGTEVSSGEDTIFVSDCFKKGLNIYSYDAVLCRGFDDGRESTWFTGYNQKFFTDRGKAYRRLSKNWIAFIFYFAIKNHKKYKESVSAFCAIKHMLCGALKVRK